MKKRKLLNILNLIVLLFVSQMMIAQGTVRGVVTGDEEPEGLISATVMIGDVGTVTEFDGSYEISVPAGTHTIQISYTSYNTYTQTFTIGDGETLEINAELITSENLLTQATVTGTKFEKPLGEVTVSLEVVKPALVESTNSTTVDEVLKRVPGVTIIDGQANIRGGSGFSYGAGSRVLLLVDDIPILAPDAGYPNWSDVPVENIAQIEVIKGAASALYGSSALNGIINIRTAYAKSEPETNFAMFTESFWKPKDDAKHWWKADSIPTPMKVGASIVHRHKFGKLDWVFGTMGYLNYSYIKNARDNKIRINNKLRYRFNDNLNAGLYVNYNRGNSNTVFFWRDHEEGAYIGDSGNMTNSNTTRFNVDPFVTYLDDNGNTVKYMGRWLKVNNDNANDQGNFSNLFYNELQYQKRFEELDMNVIGGLVSTNTGISGTLYGDTTFVSANYAIYAQLDKKFYFSKDSEGNPVTTKNALNISAGARYEFNQLDGPSVVAGNYLGDGKESEAKPVFRLGLNYQAAEFTYFRASWGQGYRYPTVAEKYITTQVAGLNIIPNPGLTSETGWSAELAVKQGYQVGPFQGFVDLSYFWSEYQDMMEFNFTNDPSNAIGLGFSSKNVGNTVINGTELSIVGQVDKDKTKFPTTFLIGYNYINPKFQEFEDIDESQYAINQPLEDILTPGQLNDFFSTSDENILKYRSRHTVKFDIETRFKMISLGVSCNGGSSIEAIDTALGLVQGVAQYHVENREGYWTFDARFAYHINDQVKASIVLKNATNREYSLRPGQLEPPASFALRVDAKF